MSVQERHNSSVLAMELRLSCANAPACTCVLLYDSHWLLIEAEGRI